MIKRDANGQGYPLQIDWGMCQTAEVLKTSAVFPPQIWRRYDQGFILLDFKSSKLHLLQFVFGLIVILTYLFLPQSAFSQESPITASVNKTNFLTDELVILTVMVMDDSAQQPRPLLPRLNGLAVIDLDISTEVDIVNGKIHTEVIYIYRLQPRRTGLLTIPPVAVKIDEDVFKTPPISINVGQGSAPAPSPGNEAQPDDILPPANLDGQDFFVESQVDLLNPYVDQQIIHTFRFYQAIHLYQKPQYEAPRFAEFETMGLPVREYNLDIAGHTYLITEIRTALFPKDPGQVAIRPIRLMLLGNFYEEPVEMYTEPITIEAKSLPDNAPPNFTGAVGQYEIRAWLEPKEAFVHEPASLYVAVGGTGNIHALPEPTWPQLSDWRAYNTLSSLDANTGENGLINGTRVFERLIVPDQVGEFTIPPVTLVYFDPLANEYQTITTDSLPIKVVPQPTSAALTPTSLAALPTATPASVAANTNAAAPAEDQVNRTFFDSPGASFGLTFPVFTILFLGICMIPLAAVAGAGGFWLWQRRRETIEGGTIETGPPLRQPQQQSHPFLAAAMQDNEDNYKAINQALNTYLETILDVPVTGLTRAEIAHYLHELGLDEAIIKRIRYCLAQSEVGRYGPITEDAGWALMARTDELLFELDEVFGGI